jgi:hypothetical protein
MSSWDLFVDKLDGNKYQVWRNQMVMYLLREHVWSVVDGYEAGLITPTNQPAWDF